ncbi:MAG: hypothetical protein WA775_07390 [Psychroserpens sp.]|uniref:hypothetical protein n=1 Tax=Psychroserpens sp. TaxID=2020870 RepID=UPI003C77A647
MQYQRLNFSIRSMACLLFICQQTLVFSSETLEPQIILSSAEKAILIQSQAHKITSISTDNELEAIKRLFKQDQVDLLFSNTKRNKNNEIISLTLQFKKSDATAYIKWNLNTRSDTPIQSIILTLEGDVFSISSENRLWKSFDLNNPNPDRRSNLSFFVTNDTKNVLAQTQKTESATITENTSKRSRSVAPFKMNTISKDKQDNAYDHTNLTQHAAPVEVTVSKSSSNNYLNDQKVLLKSFGITAEFSKIKRNKTNEITKIEITLNDQNGQKSTVNLRKKNTTIPDVSLGRSNDNDVFINVVDH